MWSLFISVSNRGYPLSSKKSVDLKTWQEEEVSAVVAMTDSLKMMV